MQMNDVIWNMAEGKERVLAYDGKDVIDRMNQLDTKTEAILVVSGMARNSNSDRAMGTAINRYGKWLVYGYYGNLYTDDWWDDRFFCDGIPENGGGICKGRGSCFQYVLQWSELRRNTFCRCLSAVSGNGFPAELPGHSEGHSGPYLLNPVFVAVDLAYLYEVACGLVRAGVGRKLRASLSCQMNKNTSNLLEIL